MRAPGRSNLVLVHMTHGNDGNKAVRLRLWCISKGVWRKMKQWQCGYRTLRGGSRGEPVTGNVVMRRRRGDTDGARIVVINYGAQGTGQ